ncbi:putative auxin-regulated protein [Blattabacterium sp. (Periplaneta americana) str. BPLAN]|uniref:GH3 auxin-responsive promoter family protein n=1 Tax=Blattabacterium sp. (Periplaneta americana) TaxID=367488 RepID=UPI0001BA0CE8|nr:GH3 auxin-responsive promoter family protein [Blattabacterium sp. (Periplaneta americana)]ACX84131.1 putative auxin-regulated protein [Blattabacterium sp. (Periplaneta americana) str. BPLAN]
MKYLSGYFTSAFLKRRIKRIESIIRNPIEIQYKLIHQLIAYAKNTEFGKKYGFCDIKKYQQFSERIPICKYPDLQSIIERIRKGEKNLLWPGKVKWFARSSGTTSTKSKYIPVTKLSMHECHYKAGKDMLSIYIHNHPKTKIFFGKALRLGGSHELYRNYNTFYGDLSSILIKNLPFWAEYISIPRKKIALMSEWEEKLETLVKETEKKDVRLLLGVCSWLLIFLNHLLKKFDKKKINDIWPHIEVIFHGGVSFKPYREQYNDLFSPSVNYYDVYSASEGFFAVQDQKNVEDLLLLLDHGIFYEFIPMEEIHNPSPKIIPIEKVELKKNYALVVSTNAGLWRYIVGDTIKFTSLSPYRISISGRTNHYINTFGEELIIENAEKALNVTCRKTDSIIHEYTAGPIYMNQKNSGAHEWIIEFKKPPRDLCYFRDTLDKELKSLNSDYEIKRYKNMILRPPVIFVARNGLFYDWLKKHRKLGGQNKIPRLSNDRKYIDSLLNMK